MSEGDDVSRLRALVGVMVEGGLTRLTSPDGYVLERPEPTPLERAMRAAPPASKEDDVDDDDILEKEEREERSLRERWNAHWERATLSSGAATPPFPGAETAIRFFGARS